MSTALHFEQTKGVRDILKKSVAGIKSSHLLSTVILCLLSCLSYILQKRDVHCTSNSLKEDHPGKCEAGID